jgi:hypothetical protein
MQTIRGRVAGFLARSAYILRRIVSGDRRISTILPRISRILARIERFLARSRDILPRIGSLLARILNKSEMPLPSRSFSWDRRRPAGTLTQSFFKLVAGGTPALPGKTARDGYIRAS